jgi:hypothetical protein
VVMRNAVMEGLYLCMLGNNQLSCNYLDSSCKRGYHMCF